MNPSIQIERQRKALLVAPLVLIPIATLFFWAFGGGKAASTTLPGSPEERLNHTLPGANIGVEKSSKMDAYTREETSQQQSNSLAPPLLPQSGLQFDSAKLGVRPVALMARSGPGAVTAPGAVGVSGESDAAGNEARVNQKLAALQKVLASQREPEEPQADPAARHSDQDMSRLVNSIHQENSGDDPELKQMDGMLEKILDIQHPNRLREKERELSLKNKSVVYPISTGTSQVPVSLMLQRAGRNASIRDSNRPPVRPAFAVQKIQAPGGNGFLGLGNSAAAGEQNAIQAVIHQAQTLVSGSTVKLRLVNDVYLGGRLIPHSSFIYGTCTISGERLNIFITSMRVGSSLFPVKLEAYDLDGLEGLYIPGALERDASKESADQAISGVQGAATIDPTVTAQATQAALEGAKSLLSKKVRQVKVLVKADHQLLLKDMSTNNLSQ